MADVVDLRQFRCSQLEPLLAAEAAEWSAILNWDYTSSAELIRQYIEARILPGYVLVDRDHGRATAQGYGFFIYESRKGMIGNLFVLPAYRGAHHDAERYLLAHMIETLRATPGLERIEAQLMPFAPQALAGSFAANGFQSYRRVFLQLDLASLPALAAAGEAAGEVDHFRDYRLEPWGGASYEEAARLILHAYENHIDSRINDQYRTFAGAVRFMHNIAHYPGCGIFDATSSFTARSLPRAALEGMVLVSRVRRDVAHITQVCIQPERQGQGLGRALILRSLESLRRHGLRSATLTVTEGNTAALALYRAIGFARLSEFDAYVWERPTPGSMR
jgi:ribosomal protein S18 acetylase RimI-like enzyme